jgi:hypothetical protein
MLVQKPVATPMKHRPLVDFLESRLFLAGDPPVNAPPLTSQVATAGVPVTVTTGVGSFLVKVGGPGEVQVFKDPVTNTVKRINVLATTTRSTVSITGAAGKLLDTEVFSATSVLGTLNAPAVRVVNGTFDLAGVRKATVGQIFGGTSRIGAAGGSPTLKFDRLFDGGLTVEAEIREISITDWADLDDAEQKLVAPSIRSIRSTETFEASVQVSGVLTKASFGALRKGVFTVGGIGSLSATSVNRSTFAVGQGSVGSISVAGALNNTAVNAGFVGRVTAGSMLSSVLVGVSFSSVRVTGEMRSSAVRASSAIGSLTARTMLVTNVFAGVKSTVTGLPTGVGDYSNTAGSIGSVKLTARAGSAAVVGSNIAAGVIRSISLGGIITTNGGTTVGVAAGQIDSFSGRTPQAGNVRATRLINANQSTAEGDFAIRVF